MRARNSNQPARARARHCFKYDVCESAARRPGQTIHRRGVLGWRELRWQASTDSRPCHLAEPSRCAPAEPARTCARQRPSTACTRRAHHRLTAGEAVRNLAAPDQVQQQQNPPPRTNQTRGAGLPRQLPHGKAASSFDSSWSARVTGAPEFAGRRASRQVVCVCIGGLAWLRWHALLVRAGRVANPGGVRWILRAQRAPGCTRALPRGREHRGRAGCRELFPPPRCACIPGAHRLSSVSGYGGRVPPPRGPRAGAITHRRQVSGRVISYGHAPRRCPSRHGSCTNELAVRG